MHTYCINLEHRNDRRDEAQLEFDREGVDVEFFRATNGRKESPTGLYISEPEYGCAMSHVRVWQDMVEKGYEIALVTEDDVRLIPNFKQKLEDLLLEAADLPWDMINIGPICPVVKTTVSENLYEGRTLSTHSYIISLECARKLAVFDPKFYKVGIDFQLNLFPIRILCVYESMSKQESLDDHIIIGFFKSIVKGDIGLQRTVDMPHHVRFGFQRFKTLIIFLVLFLVWIFVRTPFRKGI
jgi:GR25 family glycosyltransferase involved in LPS biosynthesis